MRKGHRVGYVRVSTLDQKTERQLDGIRLDKVFTDKASGKDIRRPQLTAALEYVRARETRCWCTAWIDWHATPKTSCALCGNWSGAVCRWSSGRTASRSPA